MVNDCCQRCLIVYARSDPTQARRNPTVCAEVSEDVKGQILPLGMYKNLLKTVEYFFIMPQTTAMRAAIVSGQSVFSLRTHKNPMLPVYASCKLEIPEAFADGNMVSSKIYASPKDNPYKSLVFVFFGTLLLAWKVQNGRRSESR